MLIKKIILKFELIIVIAIAGFLASCNQKVSNSEGDAIDLDEGTLIADTIIYSVVIKNPDSYDLWTEKCLSRLKKSELVDRIFEAVYSHKARAYSYSTNKPLTVSQVKEIEEREDFTRDKVAKLQFWETWNFDEVNQDMTKNVHAVLVAYEVISEEGELRGYKAAFYIKLKNNFN